MGVATRVKNGTPVTISTQVSTVPANLILSDLSNYMLKLANLTVMRCAQRAVDAAFRG